MDRVAVLGDIHGNIVALTAVLEDVRSESINQLLNTGDLAGYYYHANKVLSVLENWPCELVQGNHDAMLGEISSWSNKKKEMYRRKYGSALEQAAKELLTKEETAYLAELPYRKELHIAGRHILLCHGSPWDRDEYVYPDAPDDVLARCTNGSFDVVIMGHTHYPMVKRCGSTLILNPGSVGQPRNQQTAASWAILDLDNLDVQLRYAPYDVTAVVAEACRNDPEIPYLAEVLNRGAIELPRRLNDVRWESV